MRQLLAGIGRCDITPAPGTPQGGWGAQTHQRGIGADMPFYATAMVLTDGEETAAIIDADAIGFDREWTDKILAATVELAGLRREQVRFSCTRTHSGPNTFRLATISEGLDMALGYLESLPSRIASAVWQARRNLRRERLAGVMPSGAPIALYEDEPIDAPPPAFRVVQQKIQLPARKFHAPEELEAEAQAPVAEMNRLRREGSEDEVRRATAKATQAGWRAANARSYYGRESIEWEMQSIRIGPVALLSVAGEPFIEIAQRIAAGSPFAHTLFSGYSNGGFGYIPTREAFAEGGYEIEATPFSPDAADALVAEGLRLLREMAMERT